MIDSLYFALPETILIATDRSTPDTRNQIPDSVIKRFMIKPTDSLHETIVVATGQIDTRYQTVVEPILG